MTARRAPEVVVHGRLDGDGGSIIPEFALVLPFIIWIMLGIYEFGMGWREKLNITAALRSTARQITNQGDQRAADFLGLQSFNSIMAGAKNITVNRVVVYKAVNANGTPSNSNCLTALPPATGYSGACNIYSATQLSTLGANYLTHFGPNDTSCTGAWDTNWCPINRLANQGDPPDYVGVYVNVTYKSYTKLIPTTITMTDRVVMRIEPKVT